MLGVKTMVRRIWWILPLHAFWTDHIIIQNRSKKLDSRPGWVTLLASRATLEAS